MLIITIKDRFSILKKKELKPGSRPWSYKRLLIIILNLMSEELQ